MNRKVPFCVPLVCFVSGVILGIGSPLPAAEQGELLLTAQAASGELAGWKAFLEDPGVKVGDVWRLVDGVLTCRGTPKGYLYTEKDYGDFVLTLDWRWPPSKQPGKGGVLIRTTGPHKIWPKSLEAQLNAPDAGDFWGLDGYRLQGPADRLQTIEQSAFGRLTNLKKTAAVEKPAGQWNHYEIRAQGDTVTLTINGQVVNQATGCTPGSGKICLTSEGDEIQIRNVRLSPIGSGKQ